MKIICNQKKLTNKMSIVQKAISSKTTIELLKGVLLKTNGNELILTGYDLELGIELSVEAEIIEPGEVVINAKLFGDIIRKLPDSTIEISSDNENNVYINCLNSKFNIRGESASEYPRLPKVEKDSLVEIPQELMKNMIRETVFATSQDQTKPVLMGELLEIKNNKISFVAIDGYRLAVRTSSLKNEMHIPESRVVIPAKTLIDISGLLTGEEDVIKIGFDEKYVIFIVNGAMVISRLLEGEFIDYKKLISKESNFKIKVNKHELQGSIERASLLSLSEKNNLVKLAIRENLMIITSNTDKGNVLEEVRISDNTEFLDIAFNSRYILDALKVISCDDIFLEFTSNVNPCLITPCNDEEYTYLLLPVRVSNNV